MVGEKELCAMDRLTGKRSRPWMRPGSRSSTTTLVTTEDANTQSWQGSAFFTCHCLGVEGLGYCCVPSGCPLGTGDQPQRDKKPVEEICNRKSRCHGDAFLAAGFPDEAALLEAQNRVSFQDEASSARLVNLLAAVVFKGVSITRDSRGRPCPGSCGNPCVW